MNCKKCKRKMLCLFTSYVCEYCDRSSHLKHGDRVEFISDFLDSKECCFSAALRAALRFKQGTLEFGQESGLNYAVVVFDEPMIYPLNSFTTSTIKQVMLLENEIPVAIRKV